jgi:hypothetical protein
MLAVGRAPQSDDPARQAAAAVGVWRRVDCVTRYGEGHVRAQLAARRWTSPVPTVVVQHNGPLTTQQQIWVALFAAPPGALLHGLTAARFDGLEGFTADELGLVIPGSSYAPRRLRPGLPEEWRVRVRWSTRLGPEDVSAVAIPPRTRISRSIVDAASAWVSERRSRVLVLAAVQQRLTRVADLRDALSRRGRCRNRALIIESIQDAEGGIESLPEREFELIRRRRRLPPPQRQRILKRRDGRYFLDSDWPDFGIRAEVHGIPHSRVRNWDADLLRQNDITIAGGGLLVFSSFAIRHLPTRVGDQLETLFRSRGWRV